MPKTMAEKIISGAATYRTIKGQTEWFLIKSQTSDKWELPKGMTRTGESSVAAILRFLRENTGLKVTVIEEAGRAGSSEARLIFYLVRGESGGMDGPVFIEGTWFTYSLARRRLSLIREQRVLGQANMVLRKWQKKNGNRSH